MIRDVNLIEHLPLFIQKFREIQQIMNAENPEFQLVIDESEKIKNNQFIETSDLVGISKFEKLLNIMPLADDTLESRISRIMSRWNDVVPYTYKALIQKLVQLCDGLNFTINRNFNEYKMEIITHLELSGQVDELQYLFGYIIPVNLELTSRNEIYCDSYGQQNIGMGMVLCHSFELSDAYKADFNVQGSSMIGGGIIGSAEVTLSDNFNEMITVNGVGKTGSNASITEITGII
jgi:hypothetical protein